MISQITNFWRGLSQCQPMTLLLKLISRETLINTVTVILRVPALFIVEIWLRTDPKSVTVPMLLSKSSNDFVDNAFQSTGTHDFVVLALYYLALALAAALAFLPLKKLVHLYMHMVSASLLVAAHYCSSLYVDEEKSANMQGSVLEDSDGLRRAGIHTAIQGVISATIGYLLSMNKWAIVLVAAYLLPVLARVGNYPVEHLHRVHNFATLFEILIIAYFLFNVVPKVLDLVKTYAHLVSFEVQLFGWMPFVKKIWYERIFSLQFLTFWCVLFIVQMYRYLRLHDHIQGIEAYIVMVLTCMAESCVTPVTLFGLCATISYLAYALLLATKLFLLGRSALTEPENATQRGYTEGFTMFLLAIQTGLIELKTTQRAFLMCIVLFIVVSSLIQSMFEITDPILLALGAAQNKSVAKHVRAVILSTFLWMFPLYMAYMISQFFDMDFWLMVVISSCILTSMQVMGSLVTYSLFLYDALSSNPLENLDDFVFYAKATTRVLEFIVAVFVVCYGIHESLFGEWSWVNASILMLHCYFNVWQRLQIGWKSYLLRREASKKVSCLRDATRHELESLNDICSICYQTMQQAKVTNCEHYFHAICLRKWLYVQEHCPMCHQTIKYENTPQNGDETHDDPANDDETTDGVATGDETNDSFTSDVTEDSNEMNDVTNDNHGDSTMVHGHPCTHTNITTPDSAENISSAKDDGQNFSDTVCASEKLLSEVCRTNEPASQHLGEATSVTAGVKPDASVSSQSTVDRDVCGKVISGEHAGGDNIESVPCVDTDYGQASQQAGGQTSCISQTAKQFVTESGDS